MSFHIRAVLFTLGVLGVAQARPVIVENLSTFGTPDNVYPGFGVDVAIDGTYAIVSARRSELDPLNSNRERDFLTAFLFQRSGNQWNVVRRLAENEDDPDFEIPIALAMQNGIAAVQTVRTGIYELTPAGWALAPTQLTSDGPGRDLEIDNGRILSGDGTCGWNGLLVEKDTAGTWRTSATLAGFTRADGCDDEFRGGPVDISGDWAVVHQPSVEDQSFPETLIFKFYGGQWTPYSSARPEGEGVTTFGPEVAIRGTDVIVGGSNESGSYVYRETPFYGFHRADRFQSLDSFMGAGRAFGFAKTGEFLLQSSFSYDRNAGVVNVFRQRADLRYEHVATLVGRNGESLGNAIAISGRGILVGNNGNGLVHYFELPANLATPALIQDTFAIGNGTGWTPSAGSQFATVQAGNSRVYRQSATALEARAVLASSDFTSQSIEADIRPSQFGTAGSGFGLATRYQNAQNFFDVVVRNNGVVQLRRMAGGGLRVLAATAFTPVVNRNYRLRLESAGTLHRVYLDGRLLLDVDSTGPTHGRAVLLTDRAAADFDNVVVSPSPTTTIYAADFESGNAGPWTLGGVGLWNLWTGASTVYNQSSIAGDAHASIGVPADDQSVRLRARLDTFANPTGTQERWFGVMARFTDARNYYYLSLRSSNTVSLRKLVNGSITTLASAPFPVTPATWYSLRVDAVGDQLRAYVNGALLLEVTDGAHARGTSGPITFKAAADFDDFLTYQP